MITIELTDQEAELFKIFREHQAFIHAFKEAGGFNFRNGCIEVNYDQYGVPREFLKRERLKINYTLDVKY